MIQCTGALFVGGVLWVEVEGVQWKLDTLSRVTPRTDGTVDLYTRNDHYCATFPCEVAREAFVATCEDIGRVELC